MKTYILSLSPSLSLSLSIRISLNNVGKILICLEITKGCTQPWWLGVELLLHKLHDSVPVDLIPAVPLLSIIKIKAIVVRWLNDVINSIIFINESSSINSTPFSCLTSGSLSCWWQTNSAQSAVCILFLISKGVL